jgi:hypothetical protein
LISDLTRERIFPLKKMGAARALAKIKSRTIPVILRIGFNIELVFRDLDNYGLNTHDHGKNRAISTL